MPVSDIPLRTYILSELAGCAGNFGTVLPLLFAVSVASGMHLSLMLFWAAAWYVITGLYYRIPIPVEPLKAVGAIAIAESVTPSLIAASGIIMGIICLCIGFFGWMDRIRQVIPEPVIRGVQLGLAFIFIKSAIPGFILPDISFALISVGIVCVFILTRRFVKIPDLSALIIIVSGFFVAIISAGIPTSISISIPIPGLQIPSPEDFFNAIIHFVPPQLPLTLTNAILATSLLALDLFKKEENPDKICKTIGIMSLSASLLGGFPMCHGAGGLAAHYRFGARGGLSLILGGILLFMIGILCADPEISGALPIGMFGVLLIVVAIELAKHGLKTDNYFVTGLIAVLAVPFGLAIGFFAGLVVAWGIQYHKHRINVE
ncbi:MAG: sulfate transporter [Methanomicrobiales archaeon]|nr:sulfate transporter [Methanomicrobiales archaeon]